MDSPDSLCCAVYGGTFSPFTRTHYRVVEELVQVFDHVLVVPSAQHAFKQHVVPFHHRYAMALLALEDLAEKVVVSKVEQDILATLPPGQFVGTIDLLEYLQTQFPTWNLRFVVGTDLRAELPRWKRIEEIENRFGFYFIPEFPMVHATEVRRLRKEGDPAWRAHVTMPVAQYIETHCLYGEERTWTTIAGV